MKIFKLKEAGKASLNISGLSGLPLVLKMYRQLGLRRYVKRHLKLKQKGWDESALIEAIALLQVAGGDCLEDITAVRHDGLSRLLGGIPSPDALSRFLHLFDGDMDGRRKKGVAYVPKENWALQRLGRLTPTLIRQVHRQAKPSYVTLDADATVVFSQTKASSFTYKGPTGYQPIQGVWAEKNLVVADEFRDGNVPASYDALGFFKRCEAVFPKGTPIRYRSDGASYEHRLLKHLKRQGHRFAIGAKLSKGMMRFVRARHENQWLPLDEEGRQEYTEVRFSSASLSKAEMNQRLHDYRYLIIRTKNDQADLFDGSYSYRSMVTNMNWKPKNLIRWYREKAGMVEHTIDELKNDLAGNTFPCSTFGANAAWWRITCFIHNLIACVKLFLLPFSWFYLRLKKLRFKLFCLPGKVTCHSRRCFITLPRGHPSFSIYQHALQKLN